MESVFIEMPKDVFKMDKNVIVGVVYRPPGTNLYKFYNRMDEVIIRIQQENNRCYIMGDYDIDLLNYDMHTATAVFTDMVYASSFVPQINRPTRIIESSATLIDNIFSSDLDGLTTCTQCILVTDISDHYPVVYINGESEHVKLKLFKWNASLHLKIKSYFMKLFLIRIGARYNKLLTPRRHLQSFMLN